MGRTVGRVAAVAVLLAVSGAPRSVFAAEPSPAVKAEARDRFALGLRLFEKGQNAAALAEFKRAYELIPNPLVLYDIGLVYAAMDRPVDAVDALDRFLKDGKPAGEPAHRAQQVRDEQAKRIAEVTVVTNKPAAIQVDGAEAGRTPLEAPLRLASGDHLIGAQAPGYLPVQQQVTLAGQIKQTVTLNLVPAESTVAHLAVTVSAPGAEVLVNGKTVGLSPLPASVAVLPGNATIEARRPGYRPATRTVPVDEGATGAVTLSLEEDPAAPPALKGRLRVNVDQPGAVVFVDGADRGTTAGSVTLTLVSGPHLVRVEHAGYLPFERAVEVPAGRESVVAAVLAPTVETRERADEGQRSRRLWGWSLIGGGAAVALGAAGYALATHADIGNAQTQLNAQLHEEMTPGTMCYAGAGNEGEYLFFGCGAKKSYYQDQLDSAKLRRGLAFGAVGLGAVVAGLGTYLLVTAKGGEGALAGVGIASDGRTSLLSWSGTF